MSPSLTALLFVGLLGTAHARPEARCQDYAAQLSVMVATDQSVRSRVDWDSAQVQPGSNPPRFIQIVEIVDRGNTARFKTLVRNCGWPDKAKHGQSAVDDSWLIAQHADHDRAFQRAFLAEVRRKIASGEDLATQLAYLSDRLDVADGQPQKYGTQLKQVAPCEFEFSALDSPERVEQRRKQLGWPTLAEYKNLVHQEILPANCGMR